MPMPIRCHHADQQLGGQVQGRQSLHDTRRHRTTRHFTTLIIGPSHLDWTSSRYPTHIILPLALATVHNIFFLPPPHIDIILHPARYHSPPCFSIRRASSLDPTHIISRSDAHHHPHIISRPDAHPSLGRSISLPRPHIDIILHRYHSPPSKISLLNNHLRNNHLLNKHLLNSQRGYWQSDNQMEEEPNNKKQNNQQSNGN